MGKLKAKLNSPLKSPFSKFYYDSNITESKIISAVYSGDFFGFANVSLDCPENVKRKWKNFPPIFKKHQASLDDLCEEIKPFFSKNPTEQLTVGFRADCILLGTDYLQFLLQEGFVVTKLHWALEYQKGFHPIFSQNFQ